MRPVRGNCSSAMSTGTLNVQAAEVVTAVDVPCPTLPRETDTDKRTLVKQDLKALLVTPVTKNPRTHASKERRRARSRSMVFPIRNRRPHRTEIPPVIGLMCGSATTACHPPTKWRWRVKDLRKDSAEADLTNTFRRLESGSRQLVRSSYWCPTSGKGTAFRLFISLVTILYVKWA
jgi:hypothetical protein